MMTLIPSTDWKILIIDVEIVPLHDPPHMLKCVRNNLLTKDLEFDFEENTPKENRKFTRWDHVVKAYEIDLYAPRLSRMVPDLTDEHIYPDKIKKMSVKLMIQVFSKKLAFFIDLLSLMIGKFLYSKLTFSLLHCIITVIF